MRRFATLGLVLTLAGCGYNTWSNAPFTTGTQPYMPKGDTENLMRAEGHQVPVQAITPQAGDVWPGPLPPTPTLQDMEQQGGLEMGPEQPVPGSPATLGQGQQGQGAPSAPPQTTPGSSTPPGSNQEPTMAPLPQQEPIGGTPPATQLPAVPAPGEVVPLNKGAGVTSGGSQGYQTMTLPGGGTAVVVPNGNGTSTVIKSDGSIETIPTPK